ncbi:MAG: hypothetical protein DMF61_16605 [Blastocatellia bacterium AA13]|nr:MAG: hypothetical protein DMF61_16605 [Blastocatellia bacterium AA13]
MAARLETAIESSLSDDERGIRRLAASLYKVQLTFESRERIGEESRAALERELTDIAAEYITNRRYQTIGDIVVTVEFDLFVKSTTIQTVPSARASSDQSARPREEAELQSSNGITHRLLIPSGGAPVIIGRAAGVSLRLDDESISRHHCSLARRENGQLVLADLGSANGTMVNGRELQQGSAVEVCSGDVIKLGDLEFVFL